MKYLLVAALLTSSAVAAQATQVPPPPLPLMSPADQAQFDEDMAIISQKVTILGDDEGGAKEARFNHCFVYWQERIHHNRPPDVRHLLFTVRVARCMFRWQFALMRERAGCQPLIPSWGEAMRILLHPRCYARF